MSFFSVNLTNLRKNNKLSQEKLANDIGVARYTISDWENERTQPDNECLKKLSIYFNVSVDYLLGISKERNSIDFENTFSIDGWQTVPVYKQISCGEGCFCDDEIIDYVAVPSNIVRTKDCFAVPANGDSMINIGINDGDTLIFKKTEAYEDNDIVAVCIDTEEIALCKRVKIIGEDNILLMSENNKYSPILIDKNKKARVIGKLVYSIKKF